MGNNESKRRFMELAATTPVKALRRSSTKLFDHILTKEAHLYKGRLNNYEGFAELAYFKEEEIKAIEEQADAHNTLKFKVLLDIWLTKWEKESREEPKIRHIWDYLKMLGRQDALQECHQTILEDMEVYKYNERQKASASVEYNSETIPTSIRPHDVSRHPRFPPTPRSDVWVAISTFKYDVFINCSEDDESKAVEFVRLLENKYYMRVYFLPRDEMAGVIMYEDRAEIIETRCAKMICLVTREFEESEACQFATQYAFHLGPGVRESRIVPVLLEPNASCPKVLSYLSKVDLSSCQRGTEPYSWAIDRLVEALKSPICTYASKCGETPYSFSPGFSPEQSDRRNPIYQHRETVQRRSSDQIQQRSVPGHPTMDDIDHCESTLDSGYYTQRGSLESRQSTEVYDSGFLEVGPPLSLEVPQSHGDRRTAHRHESSHRDAQFYLSRSSSMLDQMEHISGNDTKTAVQDQIRSMRESNIAFTSHTEATLHDQDTESSVVEHDGTSYGDVLEDGVGKISFHTIRDIDNDDTLDPESILLARSPEGSLSATFTRNSERHQNDKEDGYSKVERLGSSEISNANEQLETNVKLDSRDGAQNLEVVFV